MILSGTGTFVGFGFGALPTGPFLGEAFRSGAFRRLVVAGVLPDVIAAQWRNGKRFRINIALPDHIGQVKAGPVVAVSELGATVPGVKYFTGAEPGGLGRTLARGFQRKADRHGPPAVIYTAENHAHAVEILSEQVSSEVPASERQAVFGPVRFLNTVVGMIREVLSDPAEISAAGPVPVTPVMLTRSSRRQDMLPASHLDVAEEQRVLALIGSARTRLPAWCKAGCRSGRIL